MFGFLLSPAAWFGALVIFALRVTDVSFDTLRMLFVMRGRKKIAWILGFLQSIIFVVAITSVLRDIDNLLNILGYAAGYATVNVVGMTIEQRLAIGHTRVQIVSPRRGYWRAYWNCKHSGECPSFCLPSLILVNHES